MNKRQYNIVKTFLAMGNKPEALATMFKINVIKVHMVSEAATYEQFKGLANFGADFLGL